MLSAKILFFWGDVPTSYLQPIVKLNWIHCKSLLILDFCVLIHSSLFVIPFCVTVDIFYLSNSLFLLLSLYLSLSESANLWTFSPLFFLKAPIRYKDDSNDLWLVYSYILKKGWKLRANVLEESWSEGFYHQIYKIVLNARI